jgi:hypothetical protein
LAAPAGSWKKHAIRFAENSVHVKPPQLLWRSTAQQAQNISRLNPGKLAGFFSGEYPEALADKR